MLLQEMTWPEIGNLSRDIPVLVPVAALEQHGHHMPVFTDSLLVGEVVRRVGVAMADRVLIAPLMWLGNFASYWDNANPNAGRPDLVQSQMGHACEWETSMMLRLAPHLVKDHRREPVGFGFGFEPAYRGWTTKDRTVTGHIGRPQDATADKGEYLFATYTAGVIALLEDVIAWDGKSWEMP